MVPISRTARASGRVLRARSTRHFFFRLASPLLPWFRALCNLKVFFFKEIHIECLPGMHKALGSMPSTEINQPTKQPTNQSINQSIIQITADYLSDCRTRCTCVGGVSVHMLVHAYGAIGRPQVSLVRWGLPCLIRQGLSLVLQLLDWLAQVTSERQGAPASSTVVTSIHHQAQLFLCDFWGSNSNPCDYIYWLSCSQPASHTRKKIFLCIKKWEGAPAVYLVVENDFCWHKPRSQEIKQKFKVTSYRGIFSYYRNSVYCPKSASWNIYWCYYGVWSLLSIGNFVSKYTSGMEGRQIFQLPLKH